MMDSEHEQSLDKIVFSMVAEDPDMRPTIEQVYQFQGVQWVEKRRRSGATIYEGNWGPADDVLNHEQDVDMTDV
jgi:mitosis inhibitor protein kinase SWE1